MKLLTFLLLLHIIKIYSSGLPAIFTKHCKTGTEVISYYDEETGCIPSLDNDEKVLCDGSYPILHKVSNCGTDEEEFIGEITYDNLDCINSEHVVICDKEYNAASDTCLMTLYNNGHPFQAINAKIGDCSEVHGDEFSYSILFYSDGEDIILNTYLDTSCGMNNQQPLKIKNNYYDENLDCKYECNTSPRIGKFISSIYYDDNSRIILIAVDNINDLCIDNKIHICYDNHMTKALIFDNPSCEGNPNNFNFNILSCNMKGYCAMCKDSIPPIDQSIITYFYKSMEECLNNVYDSIRVYTALNSCEIGLLYLKYNDLDSFEIIEYSNYDCDILESRQAEYRKCYSLSNGKFIKSYYNFIPNRPDSIICDDNCSLYSTLAINETIYVSVNLTLKDDSNVVIPLDSNMDTVFEVGENGIIIIENATITLDIPSEEDFKILLDTIRSNKSFEIVIIKGPYLGSFDEVNIQVPKNLDYCETINSKSKEYKDKLAIVFSIDNSGCNLKWWVILLICEGIFIVLIIVSIILVLKVKPIRSYILPYKGT